MLIPNEVWTVRARIESRYSRLWGVYELERGLERAGTVAGQTWWSPRTASIFHLVNLRSLCRINRGLFLIWLKLDLFHRLSIAYFALPLDVYFFIFSLILFFFCCCPFSVIYVNHLLLLLFWHLHKFIYNWAQFVCLFAQDMPWLLFVVPVPVPLPVSLPVSSVALLHLLAFIKMCVLTFNMHEQPYLSYPFWQLNNWVLYPLD